MISIKINKISKLNKQSHVYDLHVMGTHNFFVGNSEILISNCDGMTAISQRSLRGIMETYALHTRFILTCNYKERIIDPIQSRCQIFEIYPPSKKEVAIHLTTILKSENIIYSNENLVTIINTYYPDIRKIIQFCQQSSLTGTLVINKEMLIDGDIKNKIVDMLQRKVTFNEIRHYIIETDIHRFEEIYDFLYEKIEMYSDGKEAEITLKIAAAIINDVDVYNKQIVFLACMVDVLKVLKG